MSVALPFLQMACCAAAGPQLPLPETPGETINPPAPIAAAAAPAVTVVAAPAASAAAGNGRLRNGLDPRVDVEQLGESLAALAAARRAQQSQLLASGSRQPASILAPRSEVVRIAVIDQVRNARPSDPAGGNRTALAGIQAPILAPRLSMRFEDLVVELPQLSVEMTAPVLAANSNATPASVTTERPKQIAQASDQAFSPNESGGAASKLVKVAAAAPLPQSKPGSAVPASAAATPVASNEPDEEVSEPVVVAAIASVPSDRSAVAAPPEAAPPAQRLASSFERDSSSHRRLAVEARMMALDWPAKEKSFDSATAPERETGPHVLAFLFLLGAACWGVRTMDREA